ncbi:MAG: ATP-binding cassette domain-containing protein [Candidatus Muirbacterium halophilum]|nr:ATP-binding cassette domain-containing protein [Candidatus Muirbacterium halophilum]MCK9475705.1 ATP-binding cassette domain-containing protein [Candidatus Muirbacterium halophilum]
MNINFSLNNISKKYSNKIILENVSFDIYKNEIVSFIALNGQGKTTTLKLISGISKPDKGDIFFKEKEDFIFLPELPYFFEDFTAIECINYLLELEGIKTNKKLVEEKLESYGINEFDKKIIDFSKGMRQKTGIVICELSKRNTILMDEPYSGLDITAQRNLKKSILDMKEKGKTVFFTSHNLELVWDISDRFIILHNSNIKKIKETKEFLDFESLRNIFEKEAIGC